MSRLFRHSGRRLALGLSVLLAVGAMALPASADHEPWTSDGARTYRAAVTPGCIAAEAASVPVQLTLTNTSDGPKLGAANITVPGLTVSAPFTLSPAASGTADLDGQTIKLRGLSLEAGHELTVSFTVTSSTTTRTFPIDIDTRQANEFRAGGNSLVLYGPVPTITVGTCGVPALVFTTQPHHAERGKLVLGMGGGSPQVQLVNGSSTDPVTLELLPSGTIDAGGSEPLDENLATFEKLVIGTTGTDLRLKATLGTLTVTSDPFNVYDDLCPPEEDDCAGSYAPLGNVTGSGDYSFDLSGDTGLGTGGFIVDYRANGTGTALSCIAPSKVKITTLPGEFTVEGVGFVDGTKMLTLRIKDSYDKQGNPSFGVSQYQVCAQPNPPASQYSMFTDRYSNTLVTGTLTEDHLGQPVPTGGLSAGFLPDCSTRGDTPPCIDSRERIDKTVVIKIRWGSKFTFK
jgi:hypothetical protein